jgi:hypothetical protein
VRRLVQGLAFAAVLFHAVGGCCCHHAHAESLACQTEAAHDCHRHADKGTCQENHGEDGRPAEHRHGDGCGEGPCVFVVPESNGTLVYKPVLSPTAAIIQTDTTSLSSCLLDRFFGSPHARSSPPLRLHLLNQILLL